MQYWYEFGSVSSCANSVLTPGTCLPKACDATAPIVTGAGLGDCTSTLASGSTCAPVCPTGYVLSGVSSCSAGTLTAATCVLAGCATMPDHTLVTNAASAGTCINAIAGGTSCILHCNVGYYPSDYTCFEGTLTAPGSPCTTCEEHQHGGQTTSCTDDTAYGACNCADATACTGAIALGKYFTVGSSIINNSTCTTVSITTSSQCATGTEYSAATGIQDGQCTACEADEFSTRPDVACAARRTSCPAGFGLTGGDTTQDATCPACYGTQWSDGTVACHEHSACAIGTGVAVAGTASADAICAACVAGSTYSAAADSQACQACTACGEGTPFLSACTNISNVACGTTCTVNQFSTGGAACSADTTPSCPAGQGFSNGGNTADSSCSACEWYQYSTGGTNACVDQIGSCAAGSRYTAGSLTLEAVCTVCGQGEYNVANDQSTTCQTCAAGYEILPLHAVSGGYDCITCDVGTEYDDDGVSHTGCITTNATCDAGFEFVLTVATAPNLCEPCESHEYQALDNSFVQCAARKTACASAGIGLEGGTTQEDATCEACVSNGVNGEWSDSTIPCSNWTETSASCVAAAERYMGPATIATDTYCDNACVATTEAYNQNGVYACPCSANHYVVDRGLGSGYGMDVLVPTNVGGPSTQLSVGESHVCVLLETTSIKCWGNGGYYRLGTGTSTTHISPASSNGGQVNVAQQVTGQLHTMFRFANGEVWAVGGNGVGQIGNNSPYDQTNFVKITASNEIAVDISAANVHSCMVLVDGTVRCWGSNAYGQVGSSSSANKISPFTVPLNGRFAVKVSCGSYHTCAVFDDGTVNCWGMNQGHGQVGDPIPSGSNNYVVPDRVVALGNGDTAKEIDSGEAHTCIITNNDRLKCWGSNVQGELGIGHYNNIATPTYVLTLGKVKQLSTGSWSTCAVLSGGTLRCWGRNLYGESGYGTAVTDVHTPPTTNVNLGIGRTIKYIASGHAVSAYTRCAILDNNEVKCWGNGGDGQLGVDPKYPTYGGKNGIGLWADRYSCNACASGKTNVAGDVKLSGQTTCDT